jgi:integrase
MSKERKPRERGGKQSVWKKCGPCLYRYREGKYYALVKVKGKQVRQCLETTDLQLARRKLSKFRQDQEKVNPTESGRTISQQVEIFKKGLTGEPCTIDNANRSLRDLVDFFGGDTLLRKVVPSSCKEWVGKLDSTDLSADSKNKRIQHGRAFFQSAVDDQVIPSNPMAAIKYFTRPDPTRLTPSDEQFRAIVQDLRSQVWNGHGRDDSADFVELAGTLGLGQAELSGLQRQHINLESGEIIIFRQKTKKGFTIPIHPDARAIIERRVANMKDGPEERLLPYDNCKKGLAAACKRLGFPNFEPRSLRRYFITRALRRGVDVPTVSRWQGHKDGGVLIMSVYADVVDMLHSKKMSALLAAAPVADNVVEFQREASA